MNMNILVVFTAFILFNYVMHFSRLKGLRVVDVGAPLTCKVMGRAHNHVSGNMGDGDTQRMQVYTQYF